MKLHLIPTLIILFVAGCSSKKKTVTTVSNNSTDTQLQQLQLKYPEATFEELKKGHTLYYGTCTGCHLAKDIPQFSEKDWPGILDRMALNARIGTTEKDAILKYVMAVKKSKAK